MRWSRCALLSVLACAAIQGMFAQPNRIYYNNQQLFLTGANLAWVNFASDIGPGNTDLATFADVQLQLHENGGNAMRWWLHTNGTVTPAFNDSGFVTGPGTGTIADIKAVLDLAWEREIGVDLCLWSFDMLRTSNGTTVVNRNRSLLTDTNYTRRYINSCLIPMVQALKDHPAIIAWEIFNEPEGMSNEFGWSDIQHVPMSDIQRFINLCSGAIHRTDPAVMVTNGSWSFKALTDQTLPALGKSGVGNVQLSAAEKLQYATEIGKKYRLTAAPQEILNHLETISTLQNYNYYLDSRLIAAGGDSAGVLDFYSVHYYTGIDPTNPTSISPFHHPWYMWGLSKPIVVAEFAMQNTLGILKESLFDTLFAQGYAGGLPWSWTDVAFSSHADILSALYSMWIKNRSAVDLLGSGGHWPTVVITSPTNNSVFADTASVTIVASASDSLGSIALVEFFVTDTVKIGEATVSPYSMVWRNISPNRYTITAVATNDQGHKRTSAGVSITVGTPPMTRLEAEGAIKTGANITVGSDNGASGHAYVDVRMNDTSGSITWNVNNLKSAGTYPVTFGYRLAYASPKTQHIFVNGVFVTDLEFTAPTSTSWYEKSMNVDLQSGTNSIKMQMYWGWMQVDYLAVPTSILVDVTEEPPAVPITWSLGQNYPNPFNPTTIIEYAVGGVSGQQSVVSSVRLTIYDLLGREVATLVNEKKPAGNHTVRFDASGLASGVYLYRITAGTFVQTKKMLLLH